ncbi:MAG: hypothetical protein HFG92_06280 [Dorea sp.]|jgi:hypothetical protein|nr:hypothetical protein [Dorea sp.]
MKNKRSGRFLCQYLRGRENGYFSGGSNDREDIGIAMQIYDDNILHHLGNIAQNSKGKIVKYKITNYIYIMEIMWYLSFKENEYVFKNEQHGTDMDF